MKKRIRKIAFLQGVADKYIYTIVVLHSTENSAKHKHPNIYKVSLNYPLILSPLTFELERVVKLR